VSIHALDPARVLVVDDDPSVRKVLELQLDSLGLRVTTADSAEAALEILEQATVDLILTDVHMRAMSGVELCARVKADPRFQLTPLIILTAVSDLEARVAGLAAGADDFFAKPFNFVELRTRVSALLRVKGLLDELERAEGIITTLGLTIEARDAYTAGHCQRLSRYAVALGGALEVDAATLRALGLGGYLHDLGKIAVPDALLLKPGPLAATEREKIQIHPAKGEELVRGLKTLEIVRPIIRHHHERMDGSGYPDALKGEAIPLGARIMAVVDVYDALRTRRSYKEPLPSEQAIAILLRETEAGFWDPRVVMAFLDLLPDFEREQGRESR
jgi:putative two-component system response regulator